MAMSKQYVKGVPYSLTPSCTNSFIYSSIHWILSGAEFSKVLVHEEESNTGYVKVEAMYFFASREALQQYLDVSAPQLREEGKKLWIDTNKATFTRSISNVVFSH